MKNKRELLEKYQTLSYEEQRVLQISSLLFHTDRKTDFSNCMLKSNVRTFDHKKLYPKELNLILEKLRKQNFIDSKHNCTLQILHPITGIALDPMNRDAKDNVEAAASILRLTYEFDKDSDKNNINYLKRLNWSPPSLSEENLRFLHVSIHQNDESFFVNANLQKIGHCFSVFNDLLAIFYNHSLDISWIQTRHPVIQLFLCCVKFHFVCSKHLSFPPDLDQWIKFYKNSVPILKPDDLPVFIESSLLQIDISMGLVNKAKMRSSILPKDSFCQEEVYGTLAFLEGNDEAAIAHYESSIRFYRRIFSKAEWFRQNLHSLFYILAFIRKKEYENAFTIINLIEKNNDKKSIISPVLKMLLNLKQGNLVSAKDCVPVINASLKSNPTAMPFILALFDWAKLLLNSDGLSANRDMMKTKFIRMKDIQCEIAALVYAELITSDGHVDVDCATFLSHSPFGSLRLLDTVKTKEAWEYQIEQLHTLIVPKTETKEELYISLNDKRLVWFVLPEKKYITVAEQKIDKKGKWTAGKPIAMKRLYEQDSALTYLTHNDKLALTGIRKQLHGWYNEENFSFDLRLTLNALIGHPCVFHYDNRITPIELVKGELELSIEKRKNDYHIFLSKYSAEPCVFLEKETLNRYRVIDFGDDAVAIGSIITKHGLIVPLIGKDKIVDIVRYGKTNIKINTDIEEDNIPTIEGDPTCILQILPILDGLKLSLGVRPHGRDGLYCRPGIGNKNVLGEIQSSTEVIRQKAIRDFNLEKKNAECLIRSCPTLVEWDTQTDEWGLDTLEPCLSLLQELNEYQKNNELVIEWPKGETLKLKKKISANQFSLSIKRKNHWFEYDGEVILDQDQSLDLKRLLDLLDTSHGRFIELSKGNFIELTDSFKKQLEELKAISDGNRVYHLNTGILKSLAESAGDIKVDKSWKTHIETLKSMEKHCPIIPSTLQAELRDYQSAGFTYLSRLSHWGIGACLADDMGLGKTIQAITLLLEQAVQGPCLVVAPTSVCLIWQGELLKFAPSLNVSVLSDVSDRQACVRSLGKMDVLITSYGLLHQSGDILTEKEWHVVVLDEAQAIKNFSTKRWQYATQLNSKCRIALTGTPIENHLGEIWSIFHFLNPGLLGSQASFHNKFLLPIEKTGDLVARRALKNLVSPYILRRTKSEVLQDLPPKIEQSILIESTVEEMAFYEAVRQRAMDKIKQLDDSPNANKRFSVLAEITRLRQACCHSSLVDETIQIESSKINIFLETIKNLKENHHKVLVFSQYVRYLEKIRAILDQVDISYQYLDGSTSIKNRQIAIDAFQAGEGDVFLISLKAGGTGLNLTAADYVIILDPWWNPAVEDQAAARAHRMGQQRPVTIYRLIMKNTIEEKIVKLHKNKRDLATDLLSGGDMSGKITEEELIELILP